MLLLLLLFIINIIIIDVVVAVVIIIIIISEPQISTPVAVLTGTRRYSHFSEWLAQCQCTVTEWVSKFNLQLLSCGRTPHYQSRSDPEAHIAQRQSIVQPTLHQYLFVCWMLIVPATCECISGTDLLRQFYVLPHWDRSCRSNFPSHPVTVYWHRADQSQCWPYNARRLAG